MREYLIEMRKKRGESQQNVADALGISRQYYQQIEQGMRQQRMDIILVSKLADHFGITMNEIVRQEEKMPYWEEGK